MDTSSPFIAALSQALLARQHMLCCAESCTGGLIAACCTEIAGSSQWFERGLVTYTNVAKHENLGVPMDLIEQHGAVSQPVAHAMAQGALLNSHAHWSIAVTGIAGPGGGSPDKPVGLVWFGFAYRPSPQITALDPNAVHTQFQLFSGDRSAVRQAAVNHALLTLTARIYAL